MNRTRTIAFLVAISLAASAATALAAGEKYTLAYKFETGEELRARLKGEAKGRLEMTIDRESKKKTIMVFSSDIVRHDRVVDVAPDGTATLARWIDPMTLKMKSDDDEKVVAVADGDARVTVNGEMKPLAGGRTFSVENMSMFGQPMEVKKLTTGKTVQGRDECQDAWSKMIRRSGICGGTDDSDGLTEATTALQDSTALPDHPVMVGESWENVAEVAPSEGGPFRVVTTLVLDKVEKVRGKRIARISYSSSVDLTHVKAFTSDLPEMPHMTLKRAEKRGAGVMLFDIDNGKLERDDSEGKVEFLFTGTWEGIEGEARVIIEGKSRVQ